MTTDNSTYSPQSVKQSDFRTLLKEFNKRGVFVPRTFIDLTGDTQIASFLSQVMYWSDHTNDPDGWFYKTYDEWKSEIGLSRFQVTRCATKLKPLGLEKKVKKAGKTPKAHYRLNPDIFEAAYRQFLESQESGKSRNLQVQSPSDSEVSRLSSFSTFNVRETYTSSYIEYIQEIKDSSAKREKELLAEIANLKTKLEEMQEQLNQALSSFTKPVPNGKKKVAAPQPAKPTNPIWDVVALDIFGSHSGEVEKGHIATIIYGNPTRHIPGFMDCYFGQGVKPTPDELDCTATVIRNAVKWTRNVHHLSAPGTGEKLCKLVRDYKDSPQYKDLRETERMLNGR